MANLRLTNPAFANFTGRILEADFTDGLSTSISQSTCDQIAATLGGDLVDDEGELIGPAGAHYRKTEGPAELVDPPAEEGGDEVDGRD